MTLPSKEKSVEEEEDVEEGSIEEEETEEEEATPCDAGKLFFFFAGHGKAESGSS